MPGVELKILKTDDTVRMRVEWFFFFSSRRRHTRFDCDWSSDVCSSDLHTRRVSQGLDTTGAGYEKVTSAAQRAIALDPNLPEPYVTLAVAHLQYDHNWAASSEALAQVAKLDPNNALAHQVGGHLSAAVGRISDAVALFRRAVDLDPLNLLHRKYLGRALHYAGRPTASLAALRHAMELNPQFPGLHYEQGRALLMLNEPEAARASFEARAASGSLRDRKSTRLNSSHSQISYAVF